CAPVWTLFPYTTLFRSVFIDADKQNYAQYFDLVIDRVPVGGWILADNVLWSGRVAEAKHDKDTAALHAFNQKVQADPRVSNLLRSEEHTSELQSRENLV